MKNCKTMAEVREAIDRIDREVVDLLAERQSYVENAGRIKPSRDLVRDQGRIDDVLSKTCTRATAKGASSDMIEATYRAMVEWFIAHEFEVFDTHNESSN